MTPIFSINGINEGKIVCVAVADEASGALSMQEGNIFKEIGAKGNLYGKFRGALGIIGVKGAKPGYAVEAMSEKPLEIFALKQKS